MPTFGNNIGSLNVWGYNKVWFVVGVIFAYQYIYMCTLCHGRAWTPCHVQLAVQPHAGTWTYSTWWTRQVNLPSAKHNRFRVEIFHNLRDRNVSLSEVPCCNSIFSYSYYYYPVQWFLLNRLHANANYKIINAEE